MSPTTHDRDKSEELHNRNESRRRGIFKVLEILFWVFVAIIVVGILVFITLNVYGTEPIPVDAIPTFYK